MKDKIAQMLMDKLDNKEVKAIQIMLFMSGKGTEENDHSEGPCSECRKNECECSEEAEYKEEEGD